MTFIIPFFFKPSLCHFSLKLSPLSFSDEAPTSVFQSSVPYIATTKTFLVFSRAKPTPLSLLSRRRSCALTRRSFDLYFLPCVSSYLLWFQAESGFGELWWGWKVFFLCFCGVNSTNSTVSCGGGCGRHRSRVGNPSYHVVKVCSELNVGRSPIFLINTKPKFLITFNPNPK